MVDKDQAELVNGGGDPIKKYLTPDSFKNSMRVKLAFAFCLHPEKNGREYRYA